MSATPRTDSAIERIKTSSFRGDIIHPTFARQLETELAAANAHIAEQIVQIETLQSWKTQQMEVESKWDAQRVASLLGIAVGQDIRSNIEPKICAILSAVKGACIELDYACSHDPAANKNRVREARTILQPLIK